MMLSWLFTVLKHQLILYTVVYTVIAPESGTAHWCHDLAGTQSWRQGSLSALRRLPKMTCSACTQSQRWQKER